MKAILGYSDNDNKVRFSKVSYFNGNCSHLTLLDFYNTEHQAKKLINGGDIAIIGETPEETLYINNSTTTTTTAHEFETTEPDYTGRFYEILLFENGHWHMIFPGKYSAAKFRI